MERYKILNTFPGMLNATKVAGLVGRGRKMAGKAISMRIDSGVMTAPPARAAPK